MGALVLAIAAAGHLPGCTESRAPTTAGNETGMAPRPAPTPEVVEPLVEATFALHLQEGSHPVPPDAPEVVVHRPARFDPSATWELVVFLHGWNGCARVLEASGPSRCADGDAEEPGWGLGALAAPAGSQRLFVVPQLAYRRRSGDAGRFAEDGFAAAYLAALASKVEGWPDGPPAAIRLVAHSAGFETALAWVQHGGVAVREVALMDALYAGTEGFIGWLEQSPNRRLISIHTGHGSTARQSRRLLRMGRRADLSVATELGPAAQLVVFESDAGHRAVPETHLVEVLARPMASPASESAPTEIQ